MAFDADKYNTPTAKQMMAALLDSPNAEHFNADSDKAEWEREDYRCEAYGPGGECCRDLGHTDTSYRQGIHVSYDTDHYKDWPIGWRSPEDRLRMVQDPNFASWISGSEDFMEGFHSALNLVRHALRNTP